MKNLLLALIISLVTTGTAWAVVNINTATKEELTTLKGIGERRAQDIIEYRQKHGPFKTVDDLEKVPGIGPGIMKQIRPQISVTGKTVIEKPEESATKSKDQTSKAKASDTKKADSAKGESTKSEKKPVEKPAPEKSK